MYVWRCQSSMGDTRDASAFEMGRDGARIAVVFLLLNRDRMLYVRGTLHIIHTGRAHTEAAGEGGQAFQVAVAGFPRHAS